MAKVYDTMKKRRYHCSNSHELVEIRWGKDPLPTCSECQLEMEEVFYNPNLSAMINTDDIPGGIEIRHAICNPDGTPKRYYSKSAIREAAAAAGWTIDGETPKLRPDVEERKWREAERAGRKFI